MHNKSSVTTAEYISQVKNLEMEKLTLQKMNQNIQNGIE